MGGGLAVLTSGLPDSTDSLDSSGLSGLEEAKLAAPGAQPFITYAPLVCVYTCRLRHTEICH